MGSFVTGNTALPAPKTDSSPPLGDSSHLNAGDINDLWNAIGDLRAHAIGATIVTEWGADPAASAAANTTAIQNALNSGAARVIVPVGTFNHNELSVPTGTIFEGITAGKSILIYAGTGAGITLNGCQLSEVRRLRIITTSTAVGVRGVWVRNSGGASQWNTVENNLFIQNSGTGRNSGQVGLLVEDDAVGVLAQFWNTFEKNRFLNWETDMEVRQSGVGADGVNQNYFANCMGAAFITHLKIGPRCGDHVAIGLFGSHSSLSAFNDTVAVIGDGVANAGGSQLYGVIADMGANGRAFTINDVAARNMVIATNESSQQDQELGAGNRGNIMMGLQQLITTAHFGAGRHVQFPALDIEASGQLQSAGSTLMRSQVQADKKVSISDANYTILVSDRTILITALTATRVFTFPAAGGSAGQRITIKDKSRAASGTIKVQVKCGGVGNSVEGIVSPGTFDAIVGAPFVASFECDGTDWNLV